MAYQEDRWYDDYYEWHEYDQLGRAVRTFSNTTNFKPKTPDVENTQFSERGNLLRTVLGGKVQGVDYRYNIRGGLTSINHHNLTSTDDPGGDGLAGGPNHYVTADKFGITYGYGNENSCGIADGAAATYNGNIRWAMWAVSGVQTNGSSLVGYAYNYDRLNRLTTAVFKTYQAGCSWPPYNGYGESLTYDPNGNILSISRTLDNGATDPGLNNYQYYTNTNRLQNTDGSGNDYTYDGNGNTLTDGPSGITMTYDFMDMPVTMTKNSVTTTYMYNSGVRVKKKTGSSPAVYYVWGIAEYTDTSITAFNAAFGKVIASSGKFEKYYFLTDHVGSVRAIVDKNGALVEYSDYYAFGGILAGRNLSAINVDEQFNGKKVDGESGYLYYGARYYDLRIGRWTTTDPMDQFHSPYVYSANNAIVHRDADGRYAIIDDFIISAVAFTFGYVAHGVTTGDWGKDAFIAGGIAAGAAEAAYLTGGASMALLGNGAVGTLVAGTVGGAVGGTVGSAGNQLYFNGKIDGNELWKSTLSGAAGGMAGGAFGYYVYPNPVMTSMVGGAVSGGLDAGLHNRNIGQGMAYGSATGMMSGALTAIAYNEYGRFLAGRIKTPQQKQIVEIGRCKGFNDVLTEQGVDLPNAEFGGFQDPSHVGKVLGRDQYGQVIVLSKEGSGPVSVLTGRALNRGIGTYFERGNYRNPYSLRMEYWGGYGNYRINSSERYYYVRQP